MYCMNCGKKLPDDAKVCDNCGMPVGQYQRQEENSHASGNYGYGSAAGYDGNSGYDHTTGYDSDFGYERSSGYNQSSYEYGNGSYTSTEQPPARSGGVAIAALVLGILGAVSCCFPIISIPVSIAGIVCGALGLKSDRRNMAVAALTVCIVFLILAIAWLILGTVAAMSYMDEFWGEFYYNWY